MDLAGWVCNYRLSTKSVLLPTKTMMTSLPRSVLTSSIHRAVFRKDWRSAQIGNSSLSTWAKAVQADSTDQTKHTRDIVHHNRNRRVPNIAGYQASEALLPSCVPANAATKRYVVNIPTANAALVRLKLTKVVSAQSCLPNTWSLTESLCLWSPELAQWKLASIRGNLRTCPCLKGALPGRCCQICHT